MLNIARIHAVLCQRIHQDGAVFTDYAGVIHRAARFGDQRLHRVQAAAGGDDVVHDQNFLTLDEVGVVAAEEELLHAERGDGAVLHGDGVGHIDLGALTRDEILLRAALTRHLVNEGNGLGLGSEQIVVVQLLRQLEEVAGAGDGQLGVAEHDEGADVEVLRHLANGEIADEARNVHGIGHHSGSSFLFLPVIAASAAGILRRPAQSISGPLYFSFFSLGSRTSLSTSITPPPAGCSGTTRAMMT